MELLIVYLVIMSTDLRLMFKLNWSCRLSAGGDCVTLDVLLQEASAQRSLAYQRSYRVIAMELLEFKFSTCR